MVITTSYVIALPAAEFCLGQVRKTHCNLLARGARKNKRRRPYKNGGAGLGGSRSYTKRERRTKGGRVVGDWD
ncbi:MAG: hypothetical protein WBK28_00565 [Minisyncoccia bacterium]